MIKLGYNSSKIERKVSVIRKTVLVQISVLILVLFLSGCTMDDNPDSRIPESDPALQSSAVNVD